MAHLISPGWHAQGRQTCAFPFADVDFRWHLYGCFRSPVNTDRAPITTAGLRTKGSDSASWRLCSFVGDKGSLFNLHSVCNDALPGDHAQKVSFSTKHECSYPVIVYLKGLLQCPSATPSLIHFHLVSPPSMFPTTPSRSRTMHYPPYGPCTGIPLKLQVYSMPLPQ